MKKFMKGLTLATAIICSLFVVSCNDDEGKGDANDNTAPTIANQTFSIAEDVTNTTEVGTIVATDAEEQDLSFSIISGNDAGAFALEASTGIITVADEEQIDFETTPTYTLNIEVSDGELTSSADITIDLTDVEEDPTITVDGETFTLIDGSLEDYGSAFISGPESHYNFDFIVTDGMMEYDPSFDQYLSDEWNVVVYCELFSNGTSFEPGVYSYMNGDDLEDQAEGLKVFSEGIIAIDGNGNNGIFESEDDLGSDKYYRTVNGTITVSITDGIYTLEYDLTMAEADIETDDITGTEFSFSLTYSDEFENFLDFSGPEGRISNKKLLFKK